MAGRKHSITAVKREATFAEAQRIISDIDERHRVCDQAGQGVSDLIRLAEDGNKLPVYVLFYLTMQMVRALDSIVKVRPKLGRWLARDGFVWPTVISPKRSIRKANEELMKRLQLGKGGIFSDREWQITAPATQTALKVFIMGQSLAAKDLLPALTRKNKRLWFERTWKYLIENAFKPEESDLLRRLGESKAGKKPKYCKKLHPATRRSNARAEIKARVWKAFNQVITPNK